MLDTFTDRSTRAQWLWLVLTLMLLSGAVALDLYFDHARTDDAEAGRLSTQARVIAENIEYQLSSANLALVNVRDELPAWKKSSSPRAGTSHIKALVNAMPGIRFIGVLDEKGILQVSNLPDFNGGDFSSRDYFQEVKRHPSVDTLYVSPPFQSAAGVYVLNLTRMVAGPHGEFAGVITASLDPEYFKTLMASVLYTPDMWDALGHGDGTLFLMMPERKGLSGMNLAQPGSMFSMHRSSGQMRTIITGTVYSTGEERMMAQHTVRPESLKMDQPLVVAVSRDLGTIFHPWWRSALVESGLLGLFSIFSILGLYVYQRRHRRLKREVDLARARAERFSVALDHMPTYIYMKDRQRRYIYANQATLQLFGCSESELYGSMDDRVFPPDTVQKIHGIDTRVLECGEDTAEEVVVRDEDGTRHVYWEVKTPIYEDATKTRIWGLCGISTDITERELLKEKLEQQAHRDYLTCLFNRRYFMERGQVELARAQRYNKPLSMLMLDVDHFKAVNDTYGHKTGDLVLQKLSDVMRKELRTVDIIGRIGGEEFAILLPETGLQEATEVAERLRDKLAHAAVVPEAGLPLHFTVSIGVAALQGECSNIDILFSQSDKALYQAKEGGRNRVCGA